MLTWYEPIWAWWIDRPWLPFDPMNNPGEAACQSCHGAFRTMDMVAFGGGWVCPGCKPGFFQRLQQGEALPQTFVYGGFWERLAAKVIDSILLYVVQWPVNFAMGISMTGQAPKDPAAMGAYFMHLGLAMMINMVITASIVTFFLGRFGATPGKMAMKLKVVRPGGEPISYLQGLGRHFSEVVSGLVCYIGYIVVAFDDERRALHDRMAGTRVIKRL